LPAAAFGGRADVMSHLAPAGPVYQAGTLAGNPVAVAAGLKSLQLADHSCYYTLQTNADRLEDLLGNALHAAGVAHTVQRAGTMLSVFFTDQQVTDYAGAAAAESFRYAPFFNTLLDRGVYAPPSAFETWFVSTALTDDDFQHIADALPVAAEAAAAATPPEGARCACAVGSPCPRPDPPHCPSPCAENTPAPQTSRPRSEASPPRPPPRSTPPAGRPRGPRAMAPSPARSPRRASPARRRHRRRRPVTRPPAAPRRRPSCTWCGTARSTTRRGSSTVACPASDCPSWAAVRPRPWAGCWGRGTTSSRSSPPRCSGPRRPPHRSRRRWVCRSGSTRTSSRPRTASRATRSAGATAHCAIPATGPCSSTRCGRRGASRTCRSRTA